LHRKSSPRSPAINRSLTRRIFSQITSTCDRAGGRQLQGFGILMMLAARYRSKPFVLPDVRFSLHPRSPSHSQRVRLRVRDRPTGYDRIIRPFEESYKSVSTSISRLPSSSKPVVMTNRPASVRLCGPIDQRAYQQVMRRFDIGLRQPTGSAFHVAGPTGELLVSAASSRRRQMTPGRPAIRPRDSTQCANLRTNKN
jgi:hypothetical protein